jgi:phosphoribosyl-AMP cyclohydrolase
VEKIFDMLKLDDKGLITAVVQDAKNKDVLMVGYMDAEALRRTLSSGRVTFFSRSRQKYWVKGETSGHTQTVKELFFDCDVDCLLITVEQVGGACHEGYRTCFFRKVKPDGSFTVVQEKVFDPNKVY